ncbi:MAG: putative rane protein [Mycobacterium sp.]|nr:putative rane protein [Mycobacterium sp.]
MSWLLVVFVPGLLMLATSGLDRLEASLEGDTVSPEDIAAVLEQAKADCARPPARPDDHIVDDAYDTYETWLEHRASPASEQVLPTRIYIHHGSNPEFRATRQADRV